MMPFSTQFTPTLEQCELMTLLYPDAITREKAIEWTRQRLQYFEDKENDDKEIIVNFCRFYECPKIVYFFTAFSLEWFCGVKSHLQGEFPEYFKNLEKERQALLTKSPLDSVKWDPADHLISIDDKISFMKKHSKGMLSPRQFGKLWGQGQIDSYNSQYEQVAQLSYAHHCLVRADRSRQWNKGVIDAIYDYQQKEGILFYYGQ